MRHRIKIPKTKNVAKKESADMEIFNMYNDHKYMYEYSQTSLCGHPKKAASCIDRSPFSCPGIDIFI